MPVTMNLTLTLDGVTYGELYEFVDAVRAAGVPADERVRCIGSDDKGDRFEVELGPDRRRPGAARSASRALAEPGTAPDGPAGTPGRRPRRPWRRSPRRSGRWSATATIWTA
ncbi:hypothetical protein ACFSSF_09760 [Dietzia aerolata]|uniref:hypothetical protein n=1 Tax=Dietzia aerolata TaxID=595984 RepID=UPI003624B217